MKIAIKYYCIKIIRFFSGIFSLFPLKENQVLFYSFAGKQYSDSPKYISDFIAAHDPEKKYTLFWCVLDPGKYKDIETDSIRFIRYKSLRFLFEYIRSKYIVTNMGPIRAIARRNGQEIINTWHGGGAYKMAGTSTLYRTGYHLAYSDMAMADVTLFLSSSRAFTEACIRDSYHYDGRILNSGLPRNDILFDQACHDRIRTKVKSSFGIDQKSKVVLYAPTWKNYDMQEFEELDFESLLQSLQENFGGNWIILCRSHNLMKENILRSSQNNILDATDYPDMQELLIAADVLITDYSSVMWDYSLLKKAAFLFVPDADFYEKHVGLCTPIDTWGFAVCRSNGELAQAVRNFSADEQLKAIEENHRVFESYETGRACESVYYFITGREI